MAIDANEWLENAHVFWREDDAGPRWTPGTGRLSAIVRGPAPDVSGRVRHVASDRHAAYLHRESLSGQIRDLRRRLGWPERLVASSAVQTLTA
jgi:hypothetical protein